jgi:hypothetical protein
LFSKLKLDEAFIQNFRRQVACQGDASKEVEKWIS